MCNKQDNYWKESYFLKMSEKLSHLVVPDEVGLGMILIKPTHKRN